jgi:thymidylate synthase
MNYIEADNLEQAWGSQIRHIIQYGQRVSPRGKPTLEVLGTSLMVRNPLSCLIKHPMRDINPKYAIAEFLWIISGSNRVSDLMPFNKKMVDYSDDGEHLDGAYGPRLMNQMEYVLNTLRNDRVTRQAVATIWTPNPGPSKDIPCTVDIQFLRRPNRYGAERRDELHSIIHMRSSDVWIGLVYDFPVFAMITNMVAAEIDCELGWVEFVFGSSHLYLTDYEAAITVMDTPQLGFSVTLPKLSSIINPALAELILVNGVPDYALHNEPRFLYDVIHQPTKNDAWALIESMVDANGRLSTE